MLPDLCLELQGPAGEPVVSRLAEVKVIGAVKTYYPRSGPAARRQRGVEKRARSIIGEYTRPLARLDRRYWGTHDGEKGPLVHRLESYG